MYSSLLTKLWRRKLSTLIVSSIIILIGLWSWAFYNAAFKRGNHNRFFTIEEFPSETKHEYLIQKLISQANRVLRYQREQDNITPHSVKTNNGGGVKFLKPTTMENYLFEEQRMKILQSEQKAQQDQEDEIMNEEKELTSNERQSQYEHELHRMGIPIVAGIGPGGPRPPNERLVHLDLKGAPPKISFLKRLLPVIKSLGATGLLIEYEDMFPYTGNIEMISAKNAYKKEELQSFLESALLHGLSIIPLVQTFGHLEFVLKLQEFEHLREIPESPQSICPSQKFTMPFIEEMITQIITFHLQIGINFSNKSTSTRGTSIVSGAASSSGIGSDHGFHHHHQHYNLNYIHIGCDEVFRMGECSKCSLIAPHDLFLTHVQTIAGFIKTKWSHMKVIVWDDMLRDTPLSVLKNSQIGNYVEPMLWVYGSDIYHFLPPQTWDKFSKVFQTAWAASAFKGAFGESLMIPPIQKHLENNLKWLAVIAKEGGRFSKGFKGIALTGWQRYDHFATLCELLPTAVPSLITSLSTVSRGYFSVDVKDNAMLSVLECISSPTSRRSSHPWLELHQTAHHGHLFAKCAYPGNQVYKFVLQLTTRLVEVRTFLERAHEKSAWLSDYNIRHNFTSPLRAKDIISTIMRYIEDMTDVAKECHQIMKDIFDEHTVAEFIEQNIYPIVYELKKFENDTRSLLKTRIWQRRPLPYSNDLTKMNLFNTNDKNKD